MKKNIIKNKIKFIPASSEVEKFVPRPTLSRLEVPDWYKKIDTDYLKNPKFNPDGSIENTSLKACIPFLDSMTAGYIQKTWTDIYIESKNGKIDFAFSGGPEPMGYRDKANLKFHYGENLDIEFYWRIPWATKLPRGYSSLILHPLNRNDLPFTTMSGFIDADGYHHYPFGNMPFYIKSGFKGIIPKGTPMYQIIPIRRESWESGSEKFDEDVLEKRMRSQKSLFYGFYKNNFWKRKDYS
jgi:hypothetical protein